VLKNKDLKELKRRYLKIKALLQPRYRKIFVDDKSLVGRWTDGRSSVSIPASGELVNLGHQEPICAQSPI
jgi:hypothetical protein